MTEFSYQKSARKNSKELLFAWLAGFVIFGGIALYFIYIGQSLFLAKLIAILLVPFTIVMLSASWYMSRADRDWRINISNGVLKWQAPTSLGIFTEKTFSVELSEIDKIISKKPWPDSQSDHEFEYSIFLKNGSNIDLSLNSGIPISDLIIALGKAGISHETKST